jgi:hypothetical protein
MEPTEVQTRIRACRSEADSLVGNLAVLADRVDGARKARDEAAERHWNRQFVEAATRFMACVETILDDCWALRGRKRIRLADREVTPEEMEWIQETVEAIRASAPEGELPPLVRMVPAPAAREESLPASAPSRKRDKDPSRIDING